MVLQRSNFEIPARFSFQPFAAAWCVACAETVEWKDESGGSLLTSFEPGSRLRVRIEFPDANNSGMLAGLGIHQSNTVLMHRTCIPLDIRESHQNHVNTPDISGRRFQVLICRKPEFKSGNWTFLEPGNV